jgi:hypothetical protein
MISLVRLQDLIEIKYLLLKDSLYLGLLGSDLKKDFDLSFLSNKVLYKAIDNNNVVGLFMIQEFTNNCLIFHAGVYKQFRHKESHRYLQDCVKLIKEEFNCSLIAPILKSNIAAIKATEKAGFVIKTEIKNGAKGGDILILGE